MDSRGCLWRALCRRRRRRDSNGNLPGARRGHDLVVAVSAAAAKPAVPKSRGEISAVGWQWDAKRDRALLRQVLWVLHRGSGELRLQQIVPRHIPERKNVFRMVHTGNWPLGAEAWQRMLDQVGAAGRDVERVERWLVDAIRDASTSKLGSGTIGIHCMSVLLRPWQSPHALVRFVPGAAHEAEAFRQVVEVAYSPWMVAPDAIHAPAVHVGGWTCAQGLLTYEMNSPPIPEGQRVNGAFQTQLRHSA